MGATSCEIECYMIARRHEDGEQMISDDAVDGSVKGTCVW